MRACEEHGVTVLESDALAGELAQRRVDWVLLTEGHEQVPPALVDEIRAAVNGSGASERPAGYQINRRVRFLGRALRSQVWCGGEHVRLARCQAVAWSQSRVTSGFLAVRGRVGRLDTPVGAEPYASLRHYVSRMDVLTSATARLDGAMRPRVGLIDLGVRPILHGVRVLSLAIAKDGLAGGILALLEAYCLVVTSAKRWELRRTEPAALLR